MTESKNKYKKHATAATSREAYKKLLKTSTFQTQRWIVFEAIQKLQPVSSYDLSKCTGIERTSCARTLNGLVICDDPQIKIAFRDYHPITKAKVNYYTTIHWRPDVLNIKQWKGNE